MALTEHVYLSQEERRRFAAWCHQEAKSSYAMAEQSKKLDIAVFTKKLQAEAMAFTVVEAKLTDYKEIIITKDETE